MPIAATTANPVKNADVPYGSVRYALQATFTGFLAATLTRCRALPDGSWEDDPTAKNVRVLPGQAPELAGVASQVVAAVTAYIARKGLIATKGWSLAVRTAPGASLTCPATLVTDGGSRTEFSDLFTDTDAAEFQGVLPAVNDAVQALNTRLQLL